jgi:hypothetical protein
MDKSFNCVDCKKRMSVEARNLMRGCEKPADKDIFTWKNRISFKSCPVNYYNSGSALLVEYFRHFEKGALPFKGGLMEQPGKILDVFSLFESLKVEMELDRLKKIEKMNKKANSKWQTKSK